MSFKARRYMDRMRQWYWRWIVVPLVLFTTTFTYAETITGTEEKLTSRVTDFNTVLGQLIGFLTGNVAVAIAIAGLAMAGAMLIFQGAEMKDFIKNVLGVVVVAAVLILAGSLINLFFGITVIP